MSEQQQEACNSENFRWYAFKYRMLYHGVSARKQKQWLKQWVPHYRVWPFREVTDEDHPVSEEQEFSDAPAARRVSRSADDPKQKKRDELYDKLEKLGEVSFYFLFLWTNLLLFCIISHIIYIIRGRLSHLFFQILKEKEMLKVNGKWWRIVINNSHIRRILIAHGDDFRVCRYSDVAEIRNVKNISSKDPRLPGDPYGPQEEEIDRICDLSSVDDFSWLETGSVVDHNSGDDNGKQAILTI